MVNIPAVTPVTELDLGVDYVIDLMTIAESSGSEGVASIDGTPPDGLSLDTGANTLNGTPSTPGDYPVTVKYAGTYNDPTESQDVTFSVVDPNAPPPVELAHSIAGTVDTFLSDDLAGIAEADPLELITGTLPAGLEWDGAILQGTPEEVYSGELVLTGTRPDGAHVTLTVTVEVTEAPEGNPEWDALLDEDPQARYVADRFAGRVITHAGELLDSGDRPLAAAHVLTVLEYVKGYTRDRGFTGYLPARPLAAVIVAASARLYVNPEQLSYYQVGDYSERPATLAGWTMAELGVLRRYRRTYT